MNREFIGADGRSHYRVTGGNCVCGWTIVNDFEWERHLTNESAREKTPYRVEARGEGCPTCNHGDQLDIIGPDGSAQSQSWGDPEEAEYICELLNAAFAAGNEAVGREMLAKVGELNIQVLRTLENLLLARVGKENNAEATPQEAAPSDAPPVPADEDIPF